MTRLLFLLLITLSIASSSENIGCNGPLLDELKSTVSDLQSIIKEQNQELVIKEEKIRQLELFIREKSYLFESEIDYENPVSEAEEKVYDLQKQVFGLKREVELQRKRRLQVETRAEIADKKVAQLSSKIEMIDGKWFPSKLGLDPNKTQEYLMTLWHQHLSPTLQKKWIPGVKDACVSLTIYLQPKLQYLTHKSIEVFYTSKQALTPHLIQGFDLSYYYLEVIRAHTHPYTSQIMTIAKPHLEKVQVALEPYTENIKHGFNKLVDSTKNYHQQAQEMLKNNEVTKPVATMDLAWVAATALIGFPLIFIIKLLSAVSNPKGKKRYSHKQAPTIGYRRAKRRHPH